jgi:hypothetical protein
VLDDWPKLFDEVAAMEKFPTKYSESMNTILT